MRERELARQQAAMAGMGSGMGGGGGGGGGPSNFYQCEYGYMFTVASMHLIYPSQLLVSYVQWNLVITGSV